MCLYYEFVNWICMYLFLVQFYFYFPIKSTHCVYQVYAGVALETRWREATVSQIYRRLQHLMWYTTCTFIISYEYEWNDVEHSQFTDADGSSKRCFASIEILCVYFIFPPCQWISYQDYHTRKKRKAGSNFELKAHKHKRIILPTKKPHRNISFSKLRNENGAESRTITHNPEHSTTTTMGNKHKLGTKGRNHRVSCVLCRTHLLRAFNALIYWNVKSFTLPQWWQ